MDGSTNQRFVDHPAPGVGVFTLITAIVGVLLAACPLVMIDACEQGQTLAAFIIAAVMAIPLAIVGFYFWPLYTTYYILDAQGITVTYGPWTRQTSWDDFETLYWQRDMFVSKIGWPSVTPCVRLTNGILLKRRKQFWGLYLTPNDPAAFIRTVELFAPRLTSEMMR